MERAFLARHGESELSVLGLTNGDPARAVGLTERGREEARRLGEQLAGTEIDLCAVSEFQRAQETADLALGSRDVPRLVVPELNDVRFGEFEGGPLADYRAWARAHGPKDVVPGGESRAATVSRYVAGYRKLLERPEATILVVAHSLPLSYVLGAVEGGSPAPAVAQIPYAEAFELAAEELERAVDLLDEWARAPRWP